MDLQVAFAACKVEQEMIELEKFTKQNFKVSCVFKIIIRKIMEVSIKESSA